MRHWIYLLITLFTIPVYAASPPAAKPPEAKAPLSVVQSEPALVSPKPTPVVQAAPVPIVESPTAFYLSMASLVTQILVTLMGAIVTVMVARMKGGQDQLNVKATIAETDRAHIKTTLEATTADKKASDAVQKAVVLETLKVVNAVRVVTNHDKRLVIVAKLDLANRYYAATKDKKLLEEIETIKKELAEHDRGQDAAVEASKNDIPGVDRRVAGT